MALPIPAVWGRNRALDGARFSGAVVTAIAVPYVAWPGAPRVETRRRRICPSAHHPGVADRVIVLEQGSVRQQGTLAELVATEGSLLGELYDLTQVR